MYSSIAGFPELFHKIPEPETVRDRLAQALREVQLLRQLLRLAEKIAKNRERQNARKEAPTRNSTTAAGK